MAKKKIRGNWGILLSYIGTLYRTPADAIKEYISNAWDAWIEAKKIEENIDGCEVTYTLERDRIVIDYNSPGMDEGEFEAALNRVAESAKPGLNVAQIGQLGIIGRLGIGIFAFNQVGSKCTFYSKKAKGMPTIKVVLTSNSDDYDIETALKRESRNIPGMTIEITRLNQDPTKPRGSLTAPLLQRFFAEKFDSRLREGNLKVTLISADKVYEVKPIDIGFPFVGEAFKEVHLAGDWEKKFYCQFWFDPSGKSRVSIRNAGISIIEDLKTYPAYGIEESVYTSGYLKGYIDADFLEPLPARAGFKENQNWIRFLKELDKMRHSLEAEIEELRREEEEKRLTQVQKKAIQLARVILDQEQFRDLELLPGMRKQRSPVVHEGVRHEKTQMTGERSKEEGEREHPGGLRIAYQEIPFEEGAYLHSRFLSGMVQANELNPDFKREVEYGALMIGKEAIAYGDKSGTADYFLEKLLSFLFQVKSKASKDKLLVKDSGKSKYVTEQKKSKRKKSADKSQLRMIMSNSEEPEEV